MSNPYTLVAVKFEDEGRADQDVINALDAFDTPADVEDIKDLLQACEGCLQQYHDKHHNRTAGRLAVLLRHYTQS